VTFKGLFIGIDRYASAEISWLSCASRDAIALHALFTDTLGGEMIADSEHTTTPKRLVSPQPLLQKPIGDKLICGKKLRFPFLT
jgi:hypothetical protein